MELKVVAPLGSIELKSHFSYDDLSFSKNKKKIRKPNIHAKNRSLANSKIPKKNYARTILHV